MDLKILIVKFLSRTQEVKILWIELYQNLLFFSSRTSVFFRITGFLDLIHLSVSKTRKQSFGNSL
jgi:hypothetical protein